MVALNRKSTISNEYIISFIACFYFGEGTLDDSPQVLTIEEASKYLPKPLSTLYKHAQDGKRLYPKDGRYWPFRKETIDNWLEYQFKNEFSKEQKS